VSCEGVKEHIRINSTATDTRLLCRVIINFWPQLAECTAHQEEVKVYIKWHSSTDTYFFVCYIETDSPKQLSENCHILLPHPVFVMYQLCNTKSAFAHSSHIQN